MYSMLSIDLIDVITSKTGKERGNSYQKMKRSLDESHTDTQKLN
jgi:hypothetical protein